MAFNMQHTSQPFTTENKNQHDFFAYHSDSCSSSFYLSSRRTSVWSLFGLYGSKCNWITLYYWKIIPMATRSKREFNSRKKISKSPNDGARRATTTRDIQLWERRRIVREKKSRKFLNILHHTDRDVTLNPPKLTITSIITFLSSFNNLSGGEWKAYCQKMWLLFNVQQKCLELIEVNHRSAKRIQSTRSEDSWYSSDLIDRQVSGINGKTN